ncbi:ATP-binding protein [Inmirania thermothiophila]|uniref:ATP-dependent DNA helicase RecG n=1 Tax=Inmirania thermothiophila TaxID=1750597 RepID=A0A3N1Y5L3_9GAMM|nr:ATP-binding protein [Inmirania thermothiophila]ROR32577.1 ATP-dependent DNA helicase RecG [Inmirania thermothiophila]
MDLNELKTLVARGESEISEFKKSTAQLRRAMETLCGMLNGSGGRVLFGVTPQGRIVGQAISDKTLRELADWLRRFEPPATITQARIDLGNGKEVLMLEALPDPVRRPYVFDGRPYQRVGPTTSVMPQETYHQLLAERPDSRTRWETLLAEGYGPTDLDQEEVLRTVRLGIAAGRLPESTGNDVPDILNRLGLLKEGRLNNAAVVLFGTRFLPDYPQCQLRMARFRGVNKSEFLDQRQIEGHAFALLDEAMLFLRRHLPVAGRIVPGLFEREDEPLFPLEALREALVNAFCHRDYTIAGGAVSLAIYDDRLEIWSDGTLPAGLTPDDLKRDHPSKPRNPLIAKVFYLRGVIERWGRGTQKIVELCVKAGHPEPEFGEQAGSVWVRFLPSGYIAPHRVAHDLTERQREILHVLSKKPSMPLREIRSRLENPPSDRRLREELLHLKKLGLVSSSGHGRGSAWSLVRQDNG